MTQSKEGGRVVRTDTLEPRRIFYSWQNVGKRENRNLIQSALAKACKTLAAQVHPSDRPEVQTASSDLIGARSIPEVILERIRSADAFVADVSLVLAGDRCSPNPNVLFETGYALHALGESRMILVANTSYGPLENLPFDLRGRLTLAYEAAQQADIAAAKQTLEKETAQILKRILSLPRAQLDVRLDVGAFDIIEPGRERRKVIGFIVRNYSNFALRLTSLTFESPGRAYIVPEALPQIREPIPPRDARTIVVARDTFATETDLSRVVVAVQDSLDREWVADAGALADAFAQGEDK